MFSKKRGIIVLIAALILCGVPVLFTLTHHSSDVSAQPSTVKSHLLGKNDDGTVEKIGPYGNVSSSVKIAYIIGVHYRENKSHQALYENLKNSSSSLKYCYYIYKINATPREDYVEGRNNGQHLARDFVVPDVKKQGYNLVIDIHSYKYPQRFVFAPDGQTSRKIARQLVDKLDWLSYYFPPNQSSPQDVTIPIINSGTPAIVFENYKFQNYTKTCTQAREFIKAVDSLNF